MKLSNIHIRNYKALRDVEIPLSNFVCLTGENNAGKSSVLQALSIFMSPAKLDSNHFFDPTKEITITVTLSEIAEADLARFNQEPGERIRTLVKDGVLDLTRKFKFEDETELGYYTLLPKNKNFNKDVVAEALKGKGKKKSDVNAAIISLFPDKVTAIPAEVSTITQAKELIAGWGEALPDTEKEVQFKPIPTGADFSINPLLPDDIYIPAVKDLKDDVSVKQGSSFGKVLSILMNKIESKLSEEADLFEKLRAKITRVQKEDAIEDSRLQEIKDIESTIQRFVRESFANVDIELEIPPPELKTVLSTAKIFVNDGTPGPLDFKGDGLRRAVVFAILRTYVELNAKKKTDPEATLVEGEVKPSDRGYVLLFEEPELFLHPDAQKILFEALRIFAKEHHVIVTTHSPLFLGPGAATFVRMSRIKKEDISSKPFTVVTRVNLADMQPKDEFQLICFENNNAALFAKKVVLVEGDSEMIVFPHIAATLESDWSCAKHSVAFIQVRGKGSIQRYRSFFKRFNVPTFIIVDLDVIIRDFQKLEPSEEQQKMHNELLGFVNKTLPTEQPALNSEQIKDAQRRGSLKGLWEKAREAKSQFDADKTKLPELEEAVQNFFDWEKKESRLSAMQNSPNDEIADALKKLLSCMRESNVYILSKGEIEDYYPAASVVGKDKPSKAQSYCDVVKSRDQVIANCPNIQANPDQPAKPELEVICEAIFTQ